MPTKARGLHSDRGDARIAGSEYGIVPDNVFFLSLGSTSMSLSFTLLCIVLMLFVEGELVLGAAYSADRLPVPERSEVARAREGTLVLCHETVLPNEVFPSNSFVLLHEHLSFLWTKVKMRTAFRATHLGSCSELRPQSRRRGTLYGAGIRQLRGSHEKGSPR